MQHFGQKMSFLLLSMHGNWYDVYHLAAGHSQISAVEVRDQVLEITWLRDIFAWIIPIDSSLSRVGADYKPLGLPIFPGKQIIPKDSHVCEN